MEASATLVGGVAHDYNNLMIVVLAYAELVREDLGDGHPDAGKLGKLARPRRRQASWRNACWLIQEGASASWRGRT